MKHKLPASGYIPASETSQPGYLAKRFAAIKRELKDRDAEQARINAEAVAKVTKIKRERNA